MKKTAALILALFLLFFISSGALAASWDTVVYITKTGECYHKSGCSYLKSKIEVTLQYAVDNGYRACSRCNPPKLDSTSATRQAPTATNVPMPTRTPKPTREPYTFGAPTATPTQTYDEWLGDLKRQLQDITPTPKPTAAPKATAAPKETKAQSDSSGGTGWAIVGVAAVAYLVGRSRGRWMR